MTPTCLFQPIVTTNNDGVDVNVKVNDMGSLMTDHFVVSRNTRPAELKVGFECKKCGSFNTQKL